MATKQTISVALRDTVAGAPNITEVHFTADGHYHFRAFPYGPRLYTRLTQVAEKSRTGILTGKHTEVPINNAYGKEDERFVIVETVSREDILNAPVVETAAPTGPSKADILAALDVSEEDLKKFLATQKKK